MTLFNMLSGVDGFTLRLWTGVLGISQEQCLIDLATIKKEISKPKIHSYLAMYVTLSTTSSVSDFGQKQRIRTETNDCMKSDNTPTEKGNQQPTITAMDLAYFPRRRIPTQVSHHLLIQIKLRTGSICQA